MRLNDEQRRIAALRAYDVLDSPKEADFDKITTMSAKFFNAALTCITLVDENRFFFKSMFGADVETMDRRPGFCDTAIELQGVHCIPDASKDPLVRDHPLVNNEPHIRSYAGAPLVTSEGFAIGTICIMDPGVREFSDSEKLLLQELAEFVMFNLDRRRMLAEAQKREEKKRNIQKLESLGMLSGEIAHDFNNLLVGMLGNASLASRQIGTDSPAQETVADIILAANQASELTGQLLAYAGQRPTRPKPVNMTQLIGDMSSLLPSSVAACTTLETIVNDPLPPVIGDQTQIRQVILNLVTNASDAYRGVPGKVELSLTKTDLTEAHVEHLVDLQPGPYVRIEVADKGCGMDAETLDSAFNPFFTTKDSGRGLGMSIVQRIVRSHGGHIQLESELGQGSTVSLLLPADTNIALSFGEAPEATAVPIVGTGAALVVDDEEIVIRMTTSALKSFGYQVHGAVNGETALKLVQNDEGLAVLILDATMPGMSGAATLDAIKKLKPDLPTIITTGHHIDEVAGKFEPFDNLTFLQKPWTLEQLSAALAGAAGR